MRRKLPMGMCLVVFVLFLFAGCTLVHTFSLPPVEYPVAERIQLSVNLRLSDDFCSTKYDRRGERIEYGESLCQNAQGLAQATFDSVTVTRGSNPAPPAAADAHLTPVVVLIDRNEPMWATSEQTTTVSVEWTFSDASTGRIVWVNTFTGEGKAPKAAGMSRQEGAKIQAAALLKELFGKTRSGLLSSPEIREFAERPKSAVTGFVARPTGTATRAEGGRAELTNGQQAVARQLIGTWQGSVTLRRPSQRDISSRTLVIASVRTEGDKLVALGDYAITGQESNPVTINVDEQDGTFRLSFTTGAGSKVELTLRDKNLTGTFAGRNREIHNMQLDRVE